MSRSIFIVNKSERVPQTIAPSFGLTGNIASDKYQSLRQLFSFGFKGHRVPCSYNTGTVTRFAVRGHQMTLKTNKKEYERGAKEPKQGNDALSLLNK